MVIRVCRQTGREVDAPAIEELTNGCQCDQHGRVAVLRDSDHRASLRSCHATTLPAFPDHGSLESAAEYREKIRMNVAPHDGSCGGPRWCCKLAAVSLMLLAFFAPSHAPAQPRIRQNTAAVQPADTIVTRGKILTVDAELHTVEALAITDGRIVATGTSKQIERLAGHDTKVIDVAGATLEELDAAAPNNLRASRRIWSWSIATT
jgi:hypothetical protein